MSGFSNVRAKWVDGNLVLSNDAGTEIATIDGANVNLTVAGFALDDKADAVSDVSEISDIADTVTVEKINTIIGGINDAVDAINAVKDAIVAAGLMEEAVES
jgi:hypothetical protein